MSPKYHYSVEIPEGWKQIPQREVERNAKNISQATGQEIIYEAGFLRGQDQPPAYPYLLIQIGRDFGFDADAGFAVKIASEFRVKLRSPESSRRITEKFDLQKLDLEHVGLGFLGYDSARHTIYYTSRQEGSGVTFQGFHAGFISKRRLVILNFYAAEGELPSYRPLFQKAVESFRFHPGHALSPAKQR